MTRYDKSARILDIYERLCRGAVIQKTAEAQRFHVDVRSIQRDIDDIRAYLAERTVAATGKPQQLLYDRKKKGFLLQTNHSSLMTNSEILAISKILLESRAFSKTEMFAVLDKLVSGCVPIENMHLVTALLANEKYHYVELAHPSAIQDQLWEIGSGIAQQRLLQIHYVRQGVDSKPVVRVVEPVAVLFSEYYFYLNAYIVTRQPDGRYAHQYDYPAVFRIDRIRAHHWLEEHFSTPYATRFQEGEFRKRVQFMYPGKLEKIQFRYTGKSVDAILDRLPTARILHRLESAFEIEAEVYGNGIIMWLLSQGESVEVLGPEPMRDAMRNTLQNMLKLYSES